MAMRKKVSRGKSRRVFRRTASRMHNRNRPSSNRGLGFRGGIRL